MNAFQILALVVAGFLLFLTMLATIRGRATKREGLFWSAIWLAVMIAVFRPDLTATVARMLGIGRGADLVLYCAVVVMLIGFLMVYVRLRRLRREMTLLVRHLAIREAHVHPSARSQDDQRRNEAGAGTPRASTERPA